MVLGSSAFIVVPHRARHRASKILIVFPFLFEFADDSAKHMVVVFEHVLLELFFPHIQQVWISNRRLPIELHRKFFEIVLLLAILPAVMIGHFLLTIPDSLSD